MIPITYNLRNLAVRKTTSLATAAGLALVVFVFASALMLANGVRKTMTRAGSEDIALVMRKGAESELQSNIDDSKAAVVRASAGIAKGAQGNPLAVAETVVVVLLDKQGTDGFSNVQVRGVEDGVLEFRPHAKIIAGRAARPGTTEVVVGRALRGRFKGMDVGGSFELRKDRAVNVVGVFEDQGAVTESEIWADRELLRAAFGRQGLVSSMRVKLETAGAFDAFKSGLEQNRQLDVGVERESAYYERQSEGTSTLVTALGMIIASFAALGAAIGAMVTMYSAVANRQKEIGTLRALGFEGGSIVFAFVLESFVLALVGGAVGAVAALGMSFVHFAVMNYATWSEVVFSFEPKPQIILAALGFAGGIGLFGGLLPAVRAARVQPVDAMRGV
jgi:putative ABC transport system permease protein